MTDNTTTIFATEVLLDDDKPIWQRTRRTIRRPKPPFPPNEAIEVWLKNNAPLTFQELADIRYTIYHRCSRGDFTAGEVVEDQFELTGRHSTLRIISDGARHYLLWKLRLLGRKEKWIGAIPRTIKPRK